MRFAGSTSHSSEAPSARSWGRPDRASQRSFTSWRGSSDRRAAPARSPASRSTTSPTASSRCLRRREIGFVFQSYNLLPILTAEENISPPGDDRRWQGRPGLGGHPPRRDGHRPPARASPRRDVGRRAAACRRRARPHQPTRRSSLRTSRRETWIRSRARRSSSLLRHAVDEFGQTIVMVTHDPRAAAIADRVLFLADGRIEHDAGHMDVEEILDHLKRSDDPPRASESRGPPAADGADRHRGPPGRRDGRGHLYRDGPDPERLRGHHRPVGREARRDRHSRRGVHGSGVRGADLRRPASSTPSKACQASRRPRASSRFPAIWSSTESSSRRWEPRPSSLPLATNASIPPRRLKAAIPRPRGGQPCFGRTPRTTGSSVGRHDGDRDPLRAPRRSSWWGSFDFGEGGAAVGGATAVGRNDGRRSALGPGSRGRSPSISVIADPGVRQPIWRTASRRSCRQESDRRPRARTPTSPPTRSMTRSAPFLRRPSWRLRERPFWSAPSSSSTRSRSPSRSARASSRCCGRSVPPAVRSSPRSRPRRS